MKIENPIEAANAVKAVVTSYFEKNLLIARNELVQRSLTQVDFQSGHEQYRVTLLDKAEGPNVPASNNRRRYISIAPLSIPLLLIAGFLVSELSYRTATARSRDVCEGIQR
jgi:hypothetical protein